MAGHHIRTGEQIVVICIWTVLFAGVFTAFHGRHQKPRPVAVFSEHPTAESAPCVSYPHALVTCGVRSSDDFETARQTGPGLASHYADVGFVRPAVLKSDEWDYASFRQGDRIVWTPQPILVRSGELVLRDRYGNTIRARCGNRLSEMPREPKAFVMPPELTHEIPSVQLTDAWPPVLQPLPSGFFIPLPLLLPPNVTDTSGKGEPLPPVVLTGQPLPPLILNTPVMIRTGGTLSPGPVSTPEPSPAILMIAGAASFLYLKRSRRVS
jgi:hypothetical protein